MANMLTESPTLLQPSLPNCAGVQPGQLPPAASSAAVHLPIIDLACGHQEVCRAILDAGKEFGFFQVVNHGISDQAMQDMAAVCEEFFQLPDEDKAHLYSADKNKPNLLFSGSTYKSTEKMGFLMDCLRLQSTFPVGDSKNNWPEKPQRLREAVEKHVGLTKGLGLDLLRMLCEELGIKPDYFDGDLSGGDVVISSLRYPPCPDASVTLGLPPHCDRNLITVVMSCLVPVLEVSYNGQWIEVQPLPNSFVINFGLQAEVVTNGIIKNIEHRVKSNSTLAHTSVVTTIIGTQDCLIGPAAELLSVNNRPCYRTMVFSDFLRIYSQSLEEHPGADMKEHMKSFMI